MTESVCRLKVERGLRVCGNARVRGDTTTDGSLLPHRYVRVGLLASQEVAAFTDTVIEFTNRIAGNELVYNTTVGAHGDPARFGL